MLWWCNFWGLTFSDWVAVVPVTARVAVGVEPVLHVGLLGPLVQSLHVEQVLLCVSKKEGGEGFKWGKKEEQNILKSEPQ